MIHFKISDQSRREVIAFAPYFGEYRSYTNNYDGVLVEISPNTVDFQPKLDEFEQKITPKDKSCHCKYCRITRQVLYIRGDNQEVSGNHGGQTERIWNRDFPDF